MVLACNNYYCSVLIIIFYFSHSSTLITSNSSEGRAVPLPLFIYSFKNVFLSAWTHVFLFCSLKYSLIPVLFLVTQIVPALVIASSFRLVPVVFNWTLPGSFIKYFFIFCNHKMFHVSLAFYISWSWNRALFPEALVHYIGEWYTESKVWMLSIIIITGLLFVSDPLSRQSLVAYMHTHECMNIHVANLFMSIWVHVLKSNRFTPVPQISKYSSLLPFLICNFFLQ